MADKKVFAASALFITPDAIIAAAKKVAASGFTKWDVNTPYPVHGMDDAMNMKPSKLGFVTMFFGLAGIGIALLLMWWTLSVDYPLVIGGKPYFALPAFIPVTFEVTVLMATVSTVVSMFAIFFGLPDNKHPLHDTDYMKKVSCDHFGIIIETDDPNYNEAEVTSLLNSFKPVSIGFIYYPPEEKYPIFQPRFLMFLASTAIFVSIGTYLMLNKLMIIVPLAIAIVLLMLWVTFRSSLHAMVIISNIPLALIGGVLGLVLTGEYLSVPASVGFIALFGIAVQNGMVMVSYFNSLRERGYTVAESVHQGALVRLRPVLMTALTTVLGLFPLLLSTGIGSEVQRPLAVVVVFGLSTSTLLTLFVLPVIYLWVEDK